ncbi:MAG: hypothetical protein EXS05_11205 [Planctomycetaceae bacterium]|nr:hypothetical protein [Planctomycetaceae bacterium]
MARKTPRRLNVKRPSRRVKAATGQVTVRMYCQGLGDCFLLSFPAADGGTRPIYVMIDCGVIIGTSDATEKMTLVVEDIVATTKGTIDLLIVTHEHWDHVSGFVQAKELFEKNLKFANVWLAWTEQNGDPIADRLRREQRDKLKKLRVALANIAPALRAAEKTDPSAAGPLADLAAAEHVLDFFGPSSLSAKAGAGSTDDAMNWLRDRATRFCRPGECLAVPGARGVTAFVLGPPTDVNKLRKDAPAKGKDEAYESQAEKLGMLGALEWAGRAPEPAGAVGETVGAFSPFERHFGLSIDEAQRDPFFREYYGFPEDPLGDSGEAWRRIDYEWLAGASRLALKLDSDTNNISLALAFELPDGRTFIFPGDAQIGNWQSWHDVKFTNASNQPAPAQRVTAKKLLNKAVLYKVGHHGSHNATLKTGGLEEMTSGDLIALIPVNEVMAHKKRPPADGWKMPFDPLYERLKELTLGRVLRADRKKSDLDEAQAAAPAGAKGKWDKFSRSVQFSPTTFQQDGQPLYVELTVPLVAAGAPRPTSAPSSR